MRSAFNPSLLLPNPAPSTQPLPLRFLALIFEVQLKDVVLRNPLPSVAMDAVEVNLASAVGISIGGLVDGAAAQVASFLHGQVVAKAAVNHAVGVHGARAHREEVSAHAVALRVHIVESCEERRK